MGFPSAVVIPAATAATALLFAAILPLNRSRQATLTQREWGAVLVALPVTALLAVASVSSHPQIAATALLSLVSVPACFAAAAGRRVYRWSALLSITAWLCLAAYVSLCGFTPIPGSSADDLKFRCCLIAASTLGSQIFTAVVWVILASRHKRQHS